MTKELLIFITLISGMLFMFGGITVAFGAISEKAKTVFGVIAGVSAFCFIITFIWMVIWVISETIKT